MRIFDYVHIIKTEAILLHSYYLTMKLTEDQLNALIQWYDNTIYDTHQPYLHYFHENGLVKAVFEIIGTATLTKGYVLSKRAKEIIKRREPLRLVIDLMSRVGRGRSLPTDDLTDIVKRIPFSKLPEILACDDDYIRELAERKLRKSRFLASMR